MIIIKKADEIERMRAAGKISAIVLDKMAKSVSPGFTTGEIDEYAAELMKGLGSKSAFLGYHGYPGYTCVSINEEVVHGIPGSRKIRVGDIVSLDVGVVYDGFVGDNATTVMVGVCDPEVMRLVSVTRRALSDGMCKAVAGGRVSDISNAIETRAQEEGFSVVREFVGHGIGRAMHEDPQIPNFGPPGKGARLETGMTFAIEPMINAGSSDVEVLEDGWTVVTKDRKPSAHFEHTVAVGVDGCEILTNAV